MSKSVFLDTNTLILLSGIDQRDSEELSKEMDEHEIQINVTHVQIDERITKEYDDYQNKIKKALTTLESKGIKVCVKCTKTSTLAESISPNSLLPSVV